MMRRFYSKTKIEKEYYPSTKVHLTALMLWFTHILLLLGHHCFVDHILSSIVGAVVSTLTNLFAVLQPNRQMTYFDGNVILTTTIVCLFQWFSSSWIVHKQNVSEASLYTPLCSVSPICVWAHFPRILQKLQSLYPLVCSLPQLRPYRRHKRQYEKNFSEGFSLPRI